MTLIRMKTDQDKNLRQQVYNQEAETEVKRRWIETESVNRQKETERESESSSRKRSKEKVEKRPRGFPFTSPRM